MFFYWLHPRISMPWLRHLGLHLCYRCCTCALQGRCTYSAHTRPDAFCAFKSIRSAWSLLVAVRALYRSAVRTAPNWVPRGTVLWRCTGVVQKRSTYNAHVTWWINCSFKCIRSDAFLGGVVRALFVQRHSVSREGRVLGAVQALYRGAVRTAPMKNSAWCSSILQERRCTCRSTYSDSYSAQGIFSLTYQNASLCFRLPIYMPLWL